MANIPQAAVEIIHRLNKAGFQAVIAGGWVRDMLFGNESKDIDIATSATPDNVAKVFPDTKFVGKDFGVSLVKHLDMEFEVAMFRKDLGYTDGRHPNGVESCDIVTDAKRRDLTINALFYDVINSKVLDFVNGQTDINEKTARFVGYPSDRIKEDHIRILRFLRFRNRFDLYADTLSLNACFSNAGLLCNIAAERIGLEMNKILEQCSSAIFETMRLTNVMHSIFPELLDMYGCEQPPNYHPEGDVWIHTRMAFDEVKKLQPSLELLWATLLHDIAKPKTQAWDAVDKRYRFNSHESESAIMAKDILVRLKFSNCFQDKVFELVSSHMKFAMVRRMRVAKLKRFVFQPYFDELLKLHTADCLSSHKKLDHRDFCIEKLSEFKIEISIAVLPKPIVTGKTLIAKGFRPGPKFKDILEKCMDAQLEEEFTDLEGGTEYVLNNFREDSSNEGAS